MAVGKEAREEGRTLSLNDIQTLGQNCGQVLQERVSKVSLAA
jgi:hypothetical protein